MLDKDHLSELRRESTIGLRLQQRIAATPLPVATTVVTMEEVIRGRLAQISRARDEGERIVHYGQFQRTLAAAAGLMILRWDTAAVSILERLRGVRLRISTMDLRIASIAIANGATLLTRNLKDFSRVPGLRVENWLE